MLNTLIRSYFTSILSIALAISSLSVNATTVVLETSEGDIYLNLFDEDTPQTVENFLSYVEDGSYTNSIFHRSISNFIIQTGGFTIDGTEVSTVSKKAPVVNEPIFSNIEGTIAMAKVSGDANSATSEWFLNLSDNSENLDLQNSGFTVFGQITTEGEDGVETLATLAKIENIETCNEGGFSDLPLVDYTCNSDATPSVENYISINQVVIIDSSSATAANLTPVRNTLINSQTSDSGGGSVFWILAMLFGSLAYRFKGNSNKANT